MLANKKEFYGGIGLMTLFVVVLIIVFSPIYGGKNGLDYLDNLYNSISKGSAYYIQKARDESDEFNGTSVSVIIMPCIKMMERRFPGNTAMTKEGPFLTGGRHLRRWRKT